MHYQKLIAHIKISVQRYNDISFSYMGYSSQFYSCMPLLSGRNKSGFCYLRRFTGGKSEITFRKLSSAEHLFKPVTKGFCLLIGEASLHIVIYQFLICSNYCSYIIFVLHSSLNLKGINSCLNKGRDIREGTHILHGHDITRILLMCIQLSAWLCTSSSVTASSACKRTEQTSSAVGKAHCSMHKGFDLDRYIFLNSFKL